MVPKSLVAVLITRASPGAPPPSSEPVSWPRTTATLVSASELVPPEDWLLRDGVSALPHPASTTAVVRTRATIARMPRAKHGRARGVQKMV